MSGQDCGIDATLIETEIKSGRRFGFGENWRLFLECLDERRINTAAESLLQMLKIDTLEGKTFLDIGCGSGLFSLAARRLGATVLSFDYDQESVACALYLRSRFFPEDDQWKVVCGSALDEKFMLSIGKHDVVYSWGVLHHTGDMWSALKYASIPVAAGGFLFVAIYNDQGWGSAAWKTVKKMYCVAPAPIKWLILIFAFCRLWGPTIVRDTARGRPFSAWNSYMSVRGMNPWRDVVDWVGGYPFEVAKPEEIVKFFGDLGFTILNTRTVGSGSGCNEFVLKKSR